jgi:rfaE bifunctional protein nucleotidyltransferase chain/domain
LKRADLIPQRIFSQSQLLMQVVRWKTLRKKIVFTNGVFDILHEGHISSLAIAAKEGQFLVVGINSDASVKKLKGDTRPINHQDSRALLIASLVMVDAVVIFDEETPLELIVSIMPDVLVKGGDYTVDQIAGAKEVIANGGRVVINPILPGFSTTSLIEQVKQNQSAPPKT